MVRSKEANQSHVVLPSHKCFSSFEVEVGVKTGVCSLHVGLEHQLSSTINLSEYEGSLIWMDIL